MSHDTLIVHEKSDFPTPALQSLQSRDERCRVCVWAKAERQRREAGQRRRSVDESPRVGCVVSPLAAAC